MGLFNFLSKSKIHNVEELVLNEENVDLFLVNYYFPRIPVIIKGGAKDWSLIKKWSKDYILKNYGNYNCTIVHDSRPASSNQKSTLNNYFNNFQGKSTLTLERFESDKKSYFLKDIKIPNGLFTKNQIARYFFYHSVENAGTLPHKHSDAFNTLQQGKKHWIFYDANQSSAPKGFQELQKCHRAFPVGSHAREWFSKELNKLPSKVEKVYQCFQEPGDIVYIPIEYSHAVLNLSEVMGIVVETHRKNN